MEKRHLTPKEREKRAAENFRRGYNCPQSFLHAFEDLLPEEPERRSDIYRLAVGFGGGMGRLREVCGAVSGMVMLAGLLEGYEDTGEKGQKEALYAMIQDLALQFEQERGTILCRELLGLSEKHQAPKPEARTEDYYASRPCAGLIGTAARIFAEYLEKQNLN